MYSRCGGLVREKAGNQIVIVNYKYKKEKVQVLFWAGDVRDNSDRLAAAEVGTLKWCGVTKSPRKSLRRLMGLEGIWIKAGKASKEEWVETH